METPRSPSAPPGRVPAGAIGHNRGVVHTRYAFMPPEGVLKSRLPQYTDTVVRFLAAPSLGAEFVQFILEIAPGGGTAAPVSADVQHFFYVLSGLVQISIADGAETALPSGGYAYLPPDTSFTLRNLAPGEARILAVKKRYEEVPGIEPPAAFTGQRDDASQTNHTGLEGRGFLHLLPFGDMRHDFEMNLMFFAPGTCFPAVETHIMEHGLYMLEGQGLYYLGQDWHEIWAGDFIWMGSFCPQQFYPTGQERAAYLLYKNVNRDIDI